LKSVGQVAGMGRERDPEASKKKAPNQRFIQRKREGKGSTQKEGGKFRQRKGEAGGKEAKPKRGGVDDGKEKGGGVSCSLWGRKLGVRSFSCSHPKKSIKKKNWMCGKKNKRKPKAMEKNRLKGDSV